MSFNHALRLLRETIRPVHLGLQHEFGVPTSEAANCMSLATSYQESKCAVRDQGNDDIVGPATGFWQFEKNGGVTEIMEHGKTGPIARELCNRLGVAFTRDAVWRTFVSPNGDDLACAFARLLVWKDPAALPPATLAGEQNAYAYYDRNWRPGKKRPQDWPTSWSTARNVLGVAGTDELAPPYSPSTPVPAPNSGLSLESLDARLTRIEQSVVSVQVYGPRGA